MKAFLITLLLCSICSARPNIIYMMADDTGHERYKPYGCDVDYAPRINLLASEGMMFGNMNAASSCGPSRGMLATGRNSVRNGVQGVINANLGTNEVHIARLMQDSGYATGKFGKYNLFTNPGVWGFYEQSESLKFHGYDNWADTNATFFGATIDYKDNDTLEGYQPYIFNQGVLQFIEDHQDEPFFIRYDFGLVHTPIEPTPFNPTETDSVQMFTDMFTFMDYCVSNVLAKLDVLGLSSNTVVMWAGDNGTQNIHTTMFKGQSITGGKMTPDDTGNRVPFYVRWPGVVEAGSVYDGISSFVDIPVSIIDIAELEMPTDRIIDGRSFVDQIKGSGSTHRKYFYVDVHQGQWDSVKNYEYKYQQWAVYPDRGYNLIKLNTPYGDIIIDEADKTQVDIVNEIALKSEMSSITNRVFGDNPYGKSTSDKVLKYAP